MSAFRDSYQKARRALADEQEKKLKQQMEKEQIAEANLHELLSALSNDAYLTEELGLTPERIGNEIGLDGFQITSSQGIGRFTVMNMDIIMRWT